MFAGSTDTLADFGLSPRKARAVSPAVKVVAAAKAKAPVRCVTRIFSLIEGAVPRSDDKARFRVGEVDTPSNSPPRPRSGQKNPVATQ